MASENKAKKDYALTLFLYSNKTQQEIAERVGVSENTLSTWKKDGDWEVLRGALTATKPQLVKDFYQQINLIKAGAVDAKGQARAMDLKEAQAIRLITKAIAEMDKTLTVDMYVQVMEEFVRWFYEAKADEAATFLPWLDRFMKQKFAELG
jgi:transcriptional regulator with XRE-family HTH domain